MDFLAQCFSLFHKGGPVMYVLAFCSLVLLAIGVERYLYYKQMTEGTETFIPALHALLEKQKYFRSH